MKNGICVLINHLDIFLKSFLGLYYALHIFFFLQSVISEAVDDTEYYMLIKEYTLSHCVTMTLNFKIRQTDKNRRA